MAAISREQMSSFYDRSYFVDRSGHFDENDKPTYNPDAARDGLAPLVSLLGCRTALDCGCANGHYVHGLLLQNPPVDAYGFDISEYVVTNVCRELAERVVQHDASEPLPYDDKRFDLVIAFDLLEHLHDYSCLSTAVSEMCRVCNQYILLRQPMVVYHTQCDSDDPSEIGRAHHDWIASLNVLPHEARLALIGVHPCVVPSKPLPQHIEHPNEHPREFWIEMFQSMGYTETPLPDEYYLFPNSLCLCSFNALLFVRDA